MTSEVCSRVDGGIWEGLEGEAVEGREMLKLNSNIKNKQQQEEACSLMGPSIGGRKVERIPQNLKWGKGRLYICSILKSKQTIIWHSIRAKS